VNCIWSTLPAWILTILLLCFFLIDSHEGTAFGSFSVRSVSRQTVRFIFIQSLPSLARTKVDYGEMFRVFENQGCPVRGALCDA